MGGGGCGIGIEAVQGHFVRSLYGTYVLAGRAKVSQPGHLFMVRTGGDKQWTRLRGRLAALKLHVPLPPRVCAYLVGHVRANSEAVWVR